MFSNCEPSIHQAVLLLCKVLFIYFCNRILMFEEKKKEKDRPKGPPPKKTLTDLP